jgi:hypothetical protein
VWVAAITYPPRRERASDYLPGSDPRRGRRSHPRRGRRAYRDLASSEHYLRPARRCATVHALASWYGTDPAVYVYDEHAATYRVTDRRTYRALTVLLAVAPIGGRTYLGMALRTVAVTVAAAIAVTALALPHLPAPTCYGDDGAPCLTAVEYADVLDRYDVLRSERDGGRFTEGS